MNIEAEIKNPIKIRLKKDKTVVLVNAKEVSEYPLEPGIMFSEEHYGFIIIVDHNNRQTEITYKTQCRVQGAAIVRGKLKVFEENKKHPWIINQKTGKSEVSAFNSFTPEGLDNIIRESELDTAPYEKPVFNNPLIIEFDTQDPTNSKIVVAESKEVITLNKGVVLGNPHYGFSLSIKTAKEVQTLSYPTANRIDAIGQEEGENANIELKIYEEGKYHPWIFTAKDFLVEEAHYNEYSRRDQEYKLKKKRKTK